MTAPTPGTVATIIGKPGAATSEFWLSSVVAALNTVLAVNADSWHISAAVLSTLMGSSGLVAVGYALARAVVKRGTHAALADVISTATHAAALATEQINITAVPPPA